MAGVLESALSVRKITTGVPQLPSTSPVVGGGPSRSRKTPHAGGLWGESNGSHAAWLTARTVYQKLLSPGTTGAPAPLSRYELASVPARWVTTAMRLLSGAASFVIAIAGLG